MRSISETYAQAPEESGRRIADEFSGFFTEEAASRQAEQRDRRWTLEMLEELKIALHRTVDGYNNNVPPKFWLALVDRADHMVFSFSGVATLTLTWRGPQLLLQFHARGGEPLPATVMQVETASGEIRLRASSRSFLFRDEVFSKDEFASRLIRVVCADFFDRSAPGFVGDASQSSEEASAGGRPDIAGNASQTAFSPPGQTTRTAPGGDAVTCRSWQRFSSPSSRRNWRPGSTNW
jgi:hypothetical protein